MYDPTYAHYIAMTLHEDRLRLAAADAQIRPGAAAEALCALLGRAARHSARRLPATPTPEPATPLPVA